MQQDKLCPGVPFPGFANCTLQFSTHAIHKESHNHFLPINTVEVVVVVVVRQAMSQVAAPKVWHIRQHHRINSSL